MRDNGELRDCSKEGIEDEESEKKDESCEWYGL